MSAKYDIPKVVEVRLGGPDKEARGLYIDGVKFTAPLSVDGPQVSCTGGSETHLVEVTISFMAEEFRTVEAG